LKRGFKFEIYTEKRIIEMKGEPVELLERFISRDYLDCFNLRSIY
jgi:hypothetical protein